MPSRAEFAQPWTVIGPNAISGTSLGSRDDGGIVERYRRLLFGAIRHYTAEPDDVMDVFAHVCAAFRENDFARLRRCAARWEPTRRFPRGSWRSFIIAPS